MQDGEHLGADSVASEDRLVVGLIVDEGQPGRGGQLAGALALKLEQRADDAAVSRRQAEQGA